jgi:ABC-2 type transport system permease protein
MALQDKAGLMECGAGEMLTRIGNLVWKEALQLGRYKLLLAFVLVFPAFNLLSASEAVKADIRHIPTAVYDQDRSASSRRLVSMLRGSLLFDPDYVVDSQDALEEALRMGPVKVGLIIPPDFGADLVSNRGTAVQALLDGSETLTSLLAGAYLEGASYLYSQRLAGGTAVSVSVREIEVVEPRSRIWYNEDLRQESFQLPAELATAVAWLATLLPAVAIVRERERGTLEQLYVTPLRSTELLAGKGILAGAIAYVGFVEALAITTLHLDVPLRGSAALLMGLAAFYIVVEMGWGLVISALARTQGQAFIAAFFWLMLESILSGQIVPVENMPNTVQAFARLLPSTHFTAIARSIMLRGSGLADLWPSVLALAGMGGALYVLASVRLRGRLE